MHLSAPVRHALVLASLLAVVTVSVTAGTTRPSVATDAPPAAPGGVGAAGGGGSGETIVRWSPVAGASLYRVYARTGQGQFWLLAAVTPAAHGLIVPGKLAIVDAKHLWPWPTGKSPTSGRCYRISAVGTNGLEGPMSSLVCATPTGA